MNEATSPPPEEAPPQRYFSESARADTLPTRPGIEPKRFVQTDRPECPATDQAATVDFDIRTNPSTPIWECSAGCGPGLEYVTKIRISRGKHPNWLSIRCESICPYDRHRDDSGACTPGALPVAAASALAAEQRRQLEACVERRKELLASVAADVLAAGRAPRPWDDGQPVGRWQSAQDELWRLGGSCDGPQAPERKTVGRDYEQQRERLLAEAAPELKASADAVAVRLDRLKPLVQRVVQRADDRRRAAEQETECHDECNRASDECARRCVTLGGCDVCEASKARCARKCDQATP